mmetsp:Transcript_3707/g.12360  ORF Transcript_3707/g.12360 Transcript_3707/m.12360 type:complete len:255 (+) Transcript_3707:101-865(+)
MADCPPYHLHALTDDLLVHVLQHLDVPSLCSVSQCNKRFHGFVAEAHEAWKAHAASMGIPPPEGHRCSWRDVVRDVWSVRVGDCLEIVDTYGILSVARVLARLESPSAGPLLLVHFEGWSERWQVWVHRLHDRARIMPLSMEMRGVGSRGTHTEESFEATLKEVQGRLLQGRSAWPAPSGSTHRHGGWPQPYKMPASAEVGAAPSDFVAEIQDPNAWLSLQLQIPFLPCSQLAPDRYRCIGMQHSATIASWPGR